MEEVRREIKSFFTMFFCGLTAISLYPTSNYAENIPQDATTITKESWDMTGEALSSAIQKIGGQIGKQ